MSARVIDNPARPLVYTLRFAKDVIPRVAREMSYWESQALAIPTPELRTQALASLRAKRFHSEGGAVFAAAAPECVEVLVPLIVALQTISDYLDNLGDRTTSLDENDFRSLHQAMLDAVTITPVEHDYYAFHPHRADGGYLPALVRCCQRYVARLPDYPLVAGEVRRQLERYCDLQVYKHLPLSVREERLLGWHATHPDRHPDLAWWEFGAACGSTLGVFALFLEAAVGTTPERVEAVTRVYFPWICGLHILLDYLIDQEEDRLAGDLNFVSYYPDVQAALTGMAALVTQGKREVRALADADFHRAVLEGLLGLYLTDAKARVQGLRPFVRRLLAAGGLRARLVYAYCLRWRRRHRRMHY